MISMAAVWAWLLGSVCHRHRCFLKKKKPTTLVEVCSGKHFTRDGTTTCCLHVGSTACVSRLHQKSQKESETNDDMSLQQPRRNMHSSVIIKQETHMIYGNIDVVESQKGRKRKRSSKILDFFFFFRKQVNC